MGRQAFITQNEVTELLQLVVEINGTNNKRTTKRVSVDVSIQGCANLIKVQILDPKDYPKIKEYRLYTDSDGADLSEYNNLMDDLRKIHVRLNREHFKRIEEHVSEEYC